MSSFISSIVRAAPLVEVLQKAAGLGEEGNFEALEDDSYGRVVISYEVGPYWIEIWVSHLMNAKPEYRQYIVGVSFGFCPDFLWGWENALVTFRKEEENDIWTLEFQLEKPKSEVEGEGILLPDEVQKWYRDAARSLITDLGFDADKALQPKGLPIGDTIEVLPSIRKASKIFLTRAATAPFDVSEYKR